MFYIRIMLASALMATSFSTVASAQSLETRGHIDYSHTRHQGKSYYGGDGLPSYLKGVGTYSGAFYASRAPRNGNYFTVEGSGRGVRYRNDTASPRIIHVDSRASGENCSYEAGVCVIRP